MRYYILRMYMHVRIYTYACIDSFALYTLARHNIRAYGNQISFLYMNIHKVYIARVFRAGNVDPFNLRRA